MPYAPAYPFAGVSRSTLYRSAAWKRASREFLTGKRCADCGNTATVTDHEPPHRGEPTAFWDRRTWTPRCKPCHDQKTGKETRARWSPTRAPERHPGLSE
jgi:5-methylcytosine-specific restriction endonuclease McrA